jgi:hypothetical protein
LFVADRPEVFNEAIRQTDEAKPKSLNREGAKDARKARFESGSNLKIDFVVWFPSRSLRLRGKCFLASQKRDSNLKMRRSKVDEFVRSRILAFDVIPACPESFFFSVLCDDTIPDKRE